jgi:hypothetical protein
MGQIQKRQYKILVIKPEQKGNFEDAGTGGRIFRKFTKCTNILTFITVLKTNIEADFVLKQASCQKHMDKWRYTSKSCH